MQHNPQQHAAECSAESGVLSFKRILPESVVDLDGKIPTTKIPNTQIDATSGNIQLRECTGNICIHEQLPINVHSTQVEQAQGRAPGSAP